VKLSLLHAGAAVALSAVALPAVASDGPSASPLAWQKLPESHVTRMPAKRTAPAALPAGQRAEGLWVVRPNGESTPGYANATVVASAEHARAMRTGHFEHPLEPEKCLTGDSFVASEDAADPLPWPSVMQWQVYLTVPIANVGQNAGGPTRLSSVHVERLVENAAAGTAVVEYSDAWIDTVSLGARTFAKGSLSLVRVATGPGNVTVYAAREPGWAHFVVRAGTLPGEDLALSLGAAARQMNANLPPPFGGGQSQCGFLRVALPAGPRGAEMATVALDVFFPPELAEDGKVPPGRRVVRRRPLAVYLSASQSSADADPVGSVSFGWTAKEEQLRL
jgi:hypothetical protein